MKNDFLRRSTRALAVATLAISGLVTIAGPAAAAPSQAAVDVTAPVITDVTNAGMQYVGDTLAVSTGTWSSDQAQYTYQWYSCTDSPSVSPALDGACTLVAGATNATYSVRSGDIGNTLDAIVSDKGLDNSTTAAFAAPTAIATSTNLSYDCSVPTAPEYLTVSINVAPNQVFHVSTRNCDYYIASGAVTNPSPDPNGDYTGGTAEDTNVTGTASVSGYSIYPLEVSDNWSFTSFGPAINTVAPTVTDYSNGGGFYNGDTLNADAGTWTSDTGNFTYQWYTCTDSPTGSPADDNNCTAISGATNSSYTLQNSDLGNHIAFAMTDTGTDSSTTSAYSAPSIAVTTMPSAPAVNVVAPAINGNASTGSTLSVDNGTWHFAMAFAYQWYTCTDAPTGSPADDNNCTAIGGATNQTYIIQDSDLGNTIAAVVTATGTDASTTTAYTAPTSAVTVPVAAPDSISACTITPSSASLPVDGTVDVAVTSQGQGATYGEYVLNDTPLFGNVGYIGVGGSVTWSSASQITGPAGGTLVFNFYATDDTNPVGGVLCSLTLDVAPAPTGPAVNTELPAISDSTNAGSYLVGDTVSATSGTWTGDTATYTYQWYSCSSAPVGDPATDGSCTAVGTNESSYVLQSSDAGNVIVVDVSDQGTDSTTTVATSAATPAVTAPTVTYTVTFSAGAGTGSVASVTANAGSSITLPSAGGLTAPAGDVFAGWGYAETNYKAGASVTISSDETFTALWKAAVVPTLTLTFGTGGALRTITYHGGQTIILPRTTGNVNRDCTLKGWTNGTTLYAPGTRFTASANSTLTAVWGACNYYQSSTVYFANASGVLTNAGKAKIFAIALFIRHHHLTHVIVSGFANATGTTSVNDAVSVVRAQEAAKYLAVRLADLGVTHVSFVVKGYGASHFVSANTKADVNRRAVIEAKN